MRYELKGTLKVVKDEQVISDRFKKREFVVMIDEESQFPQPILCQFTQDRCSNLDGFTSGEQVKVDFYLKGREWSSPSGEIKYFISADAWSISKLDASAENKAVAPPADSSEVPPPPPPSPFNDATDNAEDDLPF